jgi:hypothetical protein
MRRKESLPIDDKTLKLQKKPQESRAKKLCISVYANMFVKLVLFTFVYAYILCNHAKDVERENDPQALTRLCSSF